VKQILSLWPGYCASGAMPIQMSRSLITGLVVMLILLAMVGASLKTEKDLDGEMLSYVNNLHYDFSAELDSVVTTNSKKGLGFLVFKIKEGRCDTTIEDRLNQHLINYKRIRFLYFKPGNKAKIFISRISRYQPHDIILVNSDQDKFQILRNERVILDSRVSLATVYKVYFAFWLPD
jgi:hypothetical protein